MFFDGVHFLAKWPMLVSELTKLDIRITDRFLVCKTKGNLAAVAISCGLFLSLLLKGTELVDMSGARR